MALPILDPTASAAAVHGSVRQYVQTHLAVVFPSGAIDYGGGEPFDDTVFAEWLQVRMLNPARPEGMGGPRMPGGDMGREMFHLVNLNLFVRPAKLPTPNSLRLQVLRDRVAAYFETNNRIPVRDYQDDTTTLGHLVSVGLDADRQMPTDRENELIQWNLVCALRWSERWAPIPR